MSVSRIQELADQPLDDASSARVEDEPDVRPESAAISGAAPAPRELGGPQGPEPTRYGDWERAGRCIDF